MKALAKQFNETLLALHAVQAERDRLRAALEEISKGRGPFSPDDYRFPHNAIEHFQKVALVALQGEK